jgi:hypothetical protein
MQPLAELRSWKEEVSPDLAESRVKWLRQQILAADNAIEAQQRIIAVDGPLLAYALSIDSLRASQRDLENELAEVMQQREFEVVNFALGGRRYDQHRAGAAALAEVLANMQHLYERVAQAISTAKITKKIQENVLANAQLEVAGFFSSSFGIRFATRTNVQITGDSLADSALDATFDLINAQNPVDQAARLGTRVLSRYRSLVKTLVQAQAEPKAQWTTPTGDEREWNCSFDDLTVLYNRLSSIEIRKPRTVTSVGFLSGANLRRHRFELQSDLGNITGTASADLKDKITQNFGTVCQVTYVETSFMDETTEQEKFNRTLINVEPLKPLR